MITDELREQVWGKGIKSPDFEPEKIRIDPCGAYIVHDLIGRENEYAWEIDHIIPKSILDGYGVPEELQDNIINLRPMNWRNNLSKGDDCPRYEAIYSRKGDFNVEKPSRKVISDETIKSILEFYSNHGFDIVL